MMLQTVGRVVGRAHRDHPETPEDVHEKLGAALACRQKVTNDPASLPWQEFNLSQSQAYNLLQQNQEKWSQYKPFLSMNEWVIVIDGEYTPCSTYVGFD